MSPMEEWHERCRKDKGLRKAWRLIKEVVYGFPWRYLHGRRVAKFSRWGSVQVAWSMTRLMLAMPPMPPREYWNMPNDGAPHA